jgi:hypothetical protein
MKLSQTQLAALVFGGALSITGAVWAQNGQAKAAVPAKTGQTNPKPGVHYTVLLVRDGVPQPVSVAFPFQTGDKISLAVRVDFDSYVYVLNRTMTGDPETEASRSLELVAEADRRAKPGVCPYAMVFPQPGEQYRLKAGVTQMVPPPGHTMMMKDPAGAEKLLVIVSPRPEPDIAAMFSSGSGCGNNPGAVPPGGESKADSDDDVLTKLNKRLLEMVGNSEAEPVAEQRGIVTVSHAQPKPQMPNTPVPAPSQQGTTTATPPSPKASGRNAQGSPGPVYVPKRPSQAIAVEISLKHVKAS